MSLLMMTKALSVKTGNPLRKLVLIKLADNANDHGECWPSFQHIAEQCEISKRSVINHIAALCKCGLVKKEARKGPKGNASNIYLLNLWGAGDSTGVVQEIHQGSAGDSSPGAGDSPGGSAGDSPGISHSFEPVNEPVNDHGEFALANSPEQSAKKNTSNVNYQDVLDAYHEILPDMPAVKILTDSRKTHIRAFWKKYQFDATRWRAYLRYVAENCRWMSEDRPNGKGGFWKRKNLDFLVTERCYVAVKELRADDK